MGIVNFSMFCNWNFEWDKDVIFKEFIVVFECFDDILIKMFWSVNEMEIKNWLVSGEFYVIFDGKIMDLSFKVLLGYFGVLKKLKISVKVKGW